MSGVDISENVNTNVAEAETAPQQSKKMIPQSEVDKVVWARVQKEREKLEAQHRQGQPAPTGSMGGMPAPQLDEEAIVQKLYERSEAARQKEREQYELEQVRHKVGGLIDKFEDGMKQGENLYSDFKEVTGRYKPQKYPQVTLGAAEFDNVADIMYELNKNPKSLTHLHVLAHTDPELFRDEMAALSKSIARNKEAVATNVKSTPPLNKLKTSVTAGTDTGKPSIRDLRKQKWARV